MNEQPQDERCDCGKLLFKRTHRGLEFKCNRCKRIHLIVLDHIDEEYHYICPIVDISETLKPQQKKERKQSDPTR